MMSEFGAQMHHSVSMNEWIASYGECNLAKKNIQQNLSHFTSSKAELMTDRL